MGLLALAVAMGIGRFAFTPLLPMMQDDAGLSVAAGGWLASANYRRLSAGALCPRCACRSDRPRAIRTGLRAIGAATLRWASPIRSSLWIALRTIAGVASAWVLIFVSAWAWRGWRLCAAIAERQRVSPAWARDRAGGLDLPGPDALRGPRIRRVAGAWRAVVCCGGGVAHVLTASARRRTKSTRDEITVPVDSHSRCAWCCATARSASATSSRRRSCRRWRSRSFRTRAYSAGPGRFRPGGVFLDACYRRIQKTRPQSRAVDRIRAGDGRWVMPAGIVARHRSDHARRAAGWRHAGRDHHGRVSRRHAKSGVPQASQLDRRDDRRIRDRPDHSAQSS